jgi:hypothetical protein
MQHSLDWTTLYVIIDWIVTNKCVWRKEVSACTRILGQHVWDNVLLILSRFEWWSLSVWIIFDWDSWGEWMMTTVVCEVMRVLMVWERVDELRIENMVIDPKRKH